MNEPAWATFAVIGMIDSGSTKTIEKAVQSVDPAASVIVSLSAGLASVRSVAPIALIREAIEAQGFIAEPSEGTRPARAQRAKSPVNTPAILNVLGHALLWGLLGAFIVPLVTFVVSLGLQYFDPACGTSGDSGGCAMGLISATILSIAPGAILGFLIALVHGILRIGKAAKS